MILPNSHCFIHSAFKYFLRSKAAKLEQKNLIYACLSKAIRAGGFKIAVAARLSIIPGHCKLCNPSLSLSRLLISCRPLQVTTAIFATSGMGIITFVIAAILSLPKQFITVYLGVMLNQSGDGARQYIFRLPILLAISGLTTNVEPPTSQSKIITKVVLGVTLAVTFLSLWFIIHEMNKVKVEVITGLRAKRWVLIRFSCYKLVLIALFYNVDGKSNTAPTLNLAAALTHRKLACSHTLPRSRTQPSPITPQNRGPSVPLVLLPHGPRGTSSRQSMALTLFPRRLMS